MTRSTAVLPTGLPVHRIAIEGTKAVTIMVAFDAGSRTEGADEHGAAHLMEHLVFKGGETFRSAQAVTDAAEGIGASLNAYTSHHMVAFHATVRSSSAREAVALLTDAVGRARVGSDEVAAERPVVIQEIARAADDPSRVADRLIDVATFGDHPLGRSVLGTPDAVGGLTDATLRGFRARQWPGRRGGVFLVGDVDGIPGDGLDELLTQLPGPGGSPAPPLPAPAPRSDVLVDGREAGQSHLRLSYRVDIDPRDAAERAALTVLATLLGGSMGSRLFREIRIRRGLAYLVYAFDNVFADGATLQVSAGLDPAGCVEAAARMREMITDLRLSGPTDAEVERARTYAAGQFVIACESSGVVARHAVKHAVVFGEDPDHRRTVAALDAVTPESVAAVARSLQDQPSIACVGPHDPQELR